MVSIDFAGQEPRAVQFKPMLASPAGSDIRFPVYGSAKIDGIRCVIKDDMALSRTLKPIRNAYVQEVLGQASHNGLDGELTVGPANATNVMQATTSGVMSEEGRPDFTYWAFDYWTAPQQPFSHRYNTMRRAFYDNFAANSSPTEPRIMLLPQLLLTSRAELDAFEASMLAEGFEGIMIRDPGGLYKYGRSTVKERHLLKVKRFSTAEAVVVSVEERMHNMNVLMRDPLGHASRSTHKENLVPTGLLGAFAVVMPKGDETVCSFNVSRGRMTDAEARRLWQVRETLPGKIITFSHFDASGVKDVPRFPIFRAFRDSIDLGEPK